MTHLIEVQANQALKQDKKEVALNDSTKDKVDFGPFQKIVSLHLWSHKIIYKDVITHCFIFT